MEIKITYKRNINHTYVLFSGGNIPLESYQVQMVLHGLMDGFLPTSVHTLDNRQIWYCENTSRQNLAAYCQNHALGKGELVWILGGILRILQEMQEFLLDSKCLYLTPGEIYLDLSQKRVYCCMVPFYERDVWKSLFDLSQYLLGYLDQKDEGAVTLAYGIFRYLTQGGSNPRELWTLVYGKNEKNEAEDTPKEQVPDSVYARDREEEIAQRQRDLDAFFREEEEEPSGRKPRIPIWLAWFLPGGGALLGGVFLFFNFWYLDSVFLIIGGITVLLCGAASVLNWWKWGRHEEEEDPLFKKEEWERKQEYELEQLSCDQEGGQEVSAKKIKGERESEWDAPEEGTVLLRESIPCPQAALVQVETGKRHLLDDTVLVIGKIPGTARFIIPEPAVSRIHARISPGSEGYYLEDLNSKNGTYLNGTLLEAQTPVLLQSEDVIYFADAGYTYICERSGKRKENMV